MFKLNSKTIACAGMFGALALLATFIKVPMHFGNPNLGSTPVSVAGVLFPPQIAFLTGLIKGIGASLWTGQPYIEMAAGIGDALMAVFTVLLVRKYRTDVAIICGQLSRYIFTSGLIAISVAVLLNGDPALIPSMWVAIFPAVTLSIIANTAVSLVIVRALPQRVSHIVDNMIGTRDKKPLHHVEIMNLKEEI
ncbi:hypothetical protein EF808_06825 [archaeon]|nr:MAG: hypothetical protein EF808_06825 [archaeon]